MNPTAWPPRSTTARPGAVIVGLADHPDRRVVGDALRRPESDVGPYTMTIQIVADGLHLGRPDTAGSSSSTNTCEATYRCVPSHSTSACVFARGSRVTPLSIHVWVDSSSLKMWKSWLVVSHRLPHQDPSFHQSTLSAR